MTHGDFIGEMALLGFEDWGESLYLGVREIEVELAAEKVSVALKV